jgi:hypothetical protein
MMNVYMQGLCSADLDLADAEPNCRAGPGPTCQHGVKRAPADADPGVELRYASPDGALNLIGRPDPLRQRQLWSSVTPAAWLLAGGGAAFGGVWHGWPHSAPYTMCGLWYC